MSLKVTVTRITTEEVEHELPDTCPGCGADLTADGAALREQQLVASSQPAILGRQADGTFGFVEYESSEDCGDAGEYVTGYACGPCGFLLVSTET